MATLSLEEFKEALQSDADLKDRISCSSDIFDYDNGTATIQHQNLNKYLERYSCKNAEELLDTLWFGYGIFAHIV